jgi:hypothetical protein
VIDEATPLDSRRRLIAVAALVVFGLCFTPRGATEPVGDEANPEGSNGQEIARLARPAGHATPATLALHAASQPPAAARRALS